MRSKDESPPIGGGGAQNTLYYGDNLEILRKHVKDESIDLIYLDPPFNSNVKYNVIYKTEGREESPAQIQAFDDTWTWTSESEIVYDQLMGTRIGGIISGLKEVIGTNDLMAYLVMMSIRILDLHRVLKLTGSLYLHCDPTASHYLKIVLDAVFGPQNFRNEIVWHYRKWSAGWQQFQRNHDVLLFYSKSKSKDRVFNKMYMERAESTKKRFGNKKIVSGYDKNGRRLPAQMEETVSPGVPMDDVWEIRRVAPVKQLFPTQKPQPLLERLIQASSNEGDVILDPFCGCGTAIIASEKLNRNWIGMDITHLAVNLIEKRVFDSFGTRPKVIGVPQSIDAAQKLADTNKLQFELWAISLIPKLHSNERQVGDRGIDGKGQIMVGLDKDNQPKYEKIIASVKGGRQINPGMVRDLVGTVQSERAAFGIFICIKKPTKKMHEAAVKGGIYTTPSGSQYQRVQIYTVEDYFNGHSPNIPDIVDSMRTQKQKKARRGKQTTF